MPLNDPTKSVTDAPDAARCDHEALRQCIDAAWSRLIHIGERSGAASGRLTNAEGRGAQEGTYALGDATSLQSW